jgi:hypothetical protein
MTGTIRKRQERYPDIPTTDTVWNGTTFVAQNTFQSSTGFSQTTDSHGNKISNMTNRERKWLLRNREDIGGSFSTVQVDCRGAGEFVDISNGPGLGIWTHRVGVVYAWDRNLNFSVSAAPPMSSKSQMDAFGTQAIARSLPTNPLSGMGQFLGELRDLPKLPEINHWRDRVHEFRHQTRHVDFDKMGRDAAGEYLNGVFGWAPFVGDLKKFFGTARDTSRQMANYAKGANRVLRRRYNFPVDEATTDFGGGSAWYADPPFPTALVRTPGNIYHMTQVSTKRWLSAAFTYYLPPILPGDNDFVTALNKAKQTEAYANRLFGLRLTPDLVWKLTPWSWAADWVTTGGDVIHNWSAFANDGLVLKYAYMMEHKSVIETWVLKNLVTTDGRKHELTQSRRASSKQRTIGTPYGFGVNSASFTAKQWGVIAALGISKQPLSINKG